MKVWLSQTHSTFQCLYEEIMKDKYQNNHFMILSVTIHQFEKQRVSAMSSAIFFFYC